MLTVLIAEEYITSDFYYLMLKKKNTTQAFSTVLGSQQD